MKLPAVSFLSLIAAWSPADAFVPRQPNRASKTHLCVSSEVKKEEKVEKSKTPTEFPKTLRIKGQGIPGRKEKVQLLDASTCESSLISRWEEDPERQKGFDWEIEKLRRCFGGLRMRDDGSWVKQPSKTFCQQWIEDGLQFGEFNGTHDTTAPHVCSPDPREDAETASDGFHLPAPATRSSSNPFHATNAFLTDVKSFTVTATSTGTPFITRSTEMLEAASGNHSNTNPKTQSLE
jgi:hypothetical protein